MNPSDYDAHYAELIFQDQYLGRNDMWRLGEKVAGQCIHRNQDIPFMNGPFGKIQDIYIDGQKVGLILRLLSPRTALTKDFRRYQPLESPPLPR